MARKKDLEPEFGKYYVVEVAYRQQNPIHRAIMCSWRPHTRGTSASFLSSGYEGEMNVEITSLAYLRIIEPIESLNNPYKNRYKVPTELGNSKYRKVEYGKKED